MTNYTQLTANGLVALLLCTTPVLAQAGWGRRSLGRG